MSNLPLQLQRNGKHLLAVLVVLLVSISVAVNIHLAISHSEEVARAQAKAMFDHIVLTRSWNARHGGIFVPITPSTQPNPFLNARNRDVTTHEGLELTKINPAYMTRQVSELAQTLGGVQFHITSLDPIRPKNAPTEWEREALERFERGEKETGVFLIDENKYRYMAPLITTKGCLKCHKQQGYELGDIRGGISVTHPVEEILQHREQTTLVTIIAHILALIVSFIVLWFLNRSEMRLQTLRVEKESADQANQFKGAFIANISHELRTPLNAILGMSHILGQEQLNSGQKDKLQRISEGGQRLNSMINHMLSYSRIDAGKLELSLAPLQLNRLVRQATDLMREKAEQKGLTLESAFDQGGESWLLGDAEHLQQVLIHILDNAIKYSDSGRVKVVVSVTPENDTLSAVSIEIEDSGVGMQRPPQWLEKHDFVQIESFSTRSRGGVGLGLTLSRRLMELMGGNLKIESKPGVGTRVRINLLLQVTQAPEGHSEEKQWSGVRRTSVSEPHKDEVKKLIVPLSESQRKQFSQQLEGLISALESDIPRALELVTTMIERYQDSEYRSDLVSMSDKMANFENDEAVELANRIEKQLADRSD